MYEPSAEEQYLLELMNAERAKTGAQPLAFDFDLDEAAELHSKWMIATDTFSHTGVNGSSPTQRIQSAGYNLTGSWSTGENIAWASLRGPTGVKDEVELLHTNLMNSAGHRANILNGSFREVGLGFEVGEYQGWQGAFVTQNFAKVGAAVALTGVAFSDKDGDRFYDPGEGLGGVKVTAIGAGGATYAATTYSSGGYDLTLAAGTYKVTFAGSAKTYDVTIGSQNVKLDALDASAGGGTPAPTPAPTPVVGDAGANTLTGGTGADTIQGQGGNDKLYGLAGADRLEGGTGNDTVAGGAGADTLSGGSGYDTFVFDAATSTGRDQVLDFSTAYDTIQLENGVFTALTTTGRLASAAFWKGAAAHDASDRVLYDPTSGVVSYDPDGTGAAAAQQIVKLAGGLNVTAADFVVV
jgi:Ca2+-binding RTX toxin-like protein